MKVPVARRTFTITLDEDWGSETNDINQLSAILKTVIKTEFDPHWIRNIRVDHKDNEFFEREDYGYDYYNQL